MITEKKENMLKYYNEGLNAYKQRKWDDAISAFLNALAIDPDDGPSGLYLERSKDNKINPPPENWDGVFVMKTK